MVQKTITCERFAWEILPNKESGSMAIAGKREGKSLANSVTEDQLGFSLRPSYSARQLRSIKRRAMAQ
tara:strand:+ start:79 stop:282 length:204 start_codon:yes stop_codon:yes gene_type:complete